MAEGAIRSFLEEAGAGNVVHSQTSLLHHLDGVRTLLDQWRAPQHVVVAGLAIGLYGWRADPNPANRALIRTVVGEAVEHLIYLYATIAREALVEGAATFSADAACAARM